MRFEHSDLLFALLVLPPVLVAFYWWSLRARQRLVTQFIQARLLPGLITGASPWRQKLRMGLILIATVLLILVLARPQWGATWEETTQRGLDIMVAIDTSKSMLATDIAPNRLERAKLAALDLMQQAKSDRLGLIAFAGSAFLQCPLTIDDVAFRQSLNMLNVDLIPRGGTALAEAINTALAAFKEGDNYKTLVLITDGEDNDEGAVAAAQAAAAQGLKIYTIGIGTPDGEILRITDSKGRTDYIRDDQGNAVKSRLNEALLQQIAGATEGGAYFRLAGAKTIDTLYGDFLSKLPKSEQNARLVKTYIERYHWPLGLAIALLLLEMLFPEKRGERRKSRQSTAQVVGAPAAILILALLPVVAKASPSSALKDYKDGKFDESLREYERILRQKTNDMRLHFNAGAAAYREGRMDQAAKHFGEATAAPDLSLQEQSYYNLGNALYKSGEKLPDPQKQSQMWQNAVEQYDNAIRLNTNNADAMFNREFVKKKLEQLRQQQQQQNNQNKKDQDKNQDQDQQDNQQEQQKDNEKKDQQKQDQNQQQNQDSQQQQKQDQGSKDQKDQQEQQAGKQDQEKKDQQDQQQAKAGQEQQKPEDSKDEEQQAADADGVRPMTPQEARQLLDAQKGNEQVLQFKPQGQPRSSNKPVKDW